MPARFLCFSSPAARLMVASAVFALGGPAPAQDLDGDNIPDSQELRDGALDCNHDGVLDLVDIARPHFASAIEHLNGVQAFQNNVWDVTPIDFNQDGKMDLAFTIFFETNTGRIALWRNEGGPALVFQQEITFPNSRPYSIAAGDVNADGLTDLVASDASFNRVYVLRATGPGTFAPAVTIAGESSSNGSVGLALGDLDNDGDLDIAATAWGLNKVQVWKNNGTGTFGSRTSYAVSYQPRDVAIGDFTGDGFADLAVANQFYSAQPPSADGTVSLLANTGTGAFTSAGVVTPPRGLAPYNYQSRPFFVELFDLDHDGDRDLIVSSKDSSVVSIHHNNGTGTFTLAEQFGGFPIEQDPADIKVLDLDGDGWEEVVFGDQDESGVTVLRNVKGTLVRHQNYAASIYGGAFLALIDLTGDGLAEIVSANDTWRTFSVLKNEGDLVFDAVPRIRPIEYAGSGLLADFNEDGLADFGEVTQNPPLGTINGFAVFPGIGQIGEARFGEAPVVTPIAGESYGVMPWARDFNNDGHLDVLLTNLPQAEVRLGNGDGTFGPPIQSPIQPRQLRLTINDFNADGVLDLMWIVGGHPGSALVSFGDGAGHFGPTTSYVMLREDESVASGDITGDGVPEFFGGFRQQLAPPPGGVLSWLGNNGDGTFGARQDRFITGQPLSPAVVAIAVADFDGDGDNDVMVSAGGLKLYFNPGDGNLPATPVAVSPTGGSIITPTDIDLDGDIDLYVRNATLSVVLNNGDGTFLPPMNMHRYDGNYREMYVADANNDGRPDAMIRPENSWSQYFYLNFEAVSADRNANGIPDECEGRCRCDVNLDGFVNSTDVGEFINMWFGDQANGSHFADFDENGIVNSADVGEFINVWFEEVGSDCGG